MTAFRESQPRSRSDLLWVIQSRGIAFADGRQSRIDFAFGASVATGIRVSEWPENTGRLTASANRMVPLRGASSSHYQREGEPEFTAVAVRSHEDNGPFCRESLPYPLNHDGGVQAGFADTSRRTPPGLVQKISRNGLEI